MSSAIICPGCGKKESSSRGGKVTMCDKCGAVYMPTVSIKYVLFTPVVAAGETAITPAESNRRVKYACLSKDDLDGLFAKLTELGITQTRLRNSLGFTSSEWSAALKGLEVPVRVVNKTRAWLASADVDAEKSEEVKELERQVDDHFFAPLKRLMQQEFTCGNYDIVRAMLAADGYDAAKKVRDDMRMSIFGGRKGGLASSLGTAQW